MPDIKLISDLQNALNSEKQNWTNNADAHKLKVYEDGFKIIEEKNLILEARQVGEIAPDFKLANAFGTEVILSAYLKRGPVILTWYRGGWCPYCNISLQYLQRALPEFKKEGANLIALTPELPDNSMTTIEKNQLEFEVLSDIGNLTGKLYNVVYRLPAEVSEFYMKSFDLHKYNGDESNELPLAATYIIDSSGIIKYAFLDIDFRKRSEPSQIITVLKDLKKSGPSV